MKKEESRQLEVSITPEAEGAGLLTLGSHGEMTTEAIFARLKKQDKHKEYNNYRKCIPCDRCGCCISLQGFNARGEIKTEGLWCERFEMEVGVDNTCDGAYRPKNGKRRVILNMKGAPKYAACLGAAMIDRLGVSRLEVEKTVERLEPEKPPEYIGGSGQYERIDGKEASTEKWDEKPMPRKLMN